MDGGSAESMTIHVDKTKLNTAPLILSPKQYLNTSWIIIMD